MVTGITVKIKDSLPGAWQAVAPRDLQKTADKNPFDVFSVFPWGIVK